MPFFVVPPFFDVVPLRPRVRPAESGGDDISVDGDGKISDSGRSSAAMFGTDMRRLLGGDDDGKISLSVAVFALDGLGGGELGAAMEAKSEAKGSVSTMGDDMVPVFVSFRFGCGFCNELRVFSGGVFDLKDGGGAGAALRGCGDDGTDIDEFDDTGAWN